MSQWELFPRESRCAFPRESRATSNSRPLTVRFDNNNKECKQNANKPNTKTKTKNNPQWVAASSPANAAKWNASNNNNKNNNKNNEELYKAQFPWSPWLKAPRSSRQRTNWEPPTERRLKQIITFPMTTLYLDSTSGEKISINCKLI